jgi:hypothetical protein
LSVTNAPLAVPPPLSVMAVTATATCLPMNWAIDHTTALSASGSLVWSFLAP